jgi:hypothetical protein
MTKTKKQKLQELNWGIPRPRTDWYHYHEVGATFALYHEHGPYLTHDHNEKSFSFDLLELDNFNDRTILTEMGFGIPVA